jgi:hypothetical protein
VSRRSAALLGALAVAACTPAAAGAHGLIQRANLPIPEWLFGWAAAAVLVVSFVALAALWPRPVLEGRATRRPLGRFGRVVAGPVVQTACAAVGLVLWALTMVAGFAGTADAAENFAPTFLFITFWVGLAIVSPLLGDVYRAANPFRTLGRLARLRGRRPYPEGLGRWPAVAGLLAFAWLELCSGSLREDPRFLAGCVAGYSVLTLAAMARYGVEQWLERGETFAVYFGLLARISPLETRDGTVGVRPPLLGLTRLDQAPGTVAFVCAMIGTVTYDGLSQGKAWVSIADHLDGPLGERLTATLGLLAATAVVAGFYALGSGARRRTFVHSLGPIALAYVVAHYLTFLLFEGQGIFGLLSDPLGQGWDLLGTADTTINYGLISQNQTWYVQVGVVVVGHVAALMLAHERALITFSDARRAAHSQRWMLLVMVGFTSLALWLLSQAGSGIAAKEASPVTAEQRFGRLVDFRKKPPYVNALEIDPVNGDFLLTTNRGFWRIDRETKAVSRIRGTITAKGKTDTLGTFLLVKAAGGERLIGSGHPDHQNTLPQFLGFLESENRGRTWRVVSRFGGADLHKIVLAHDRMYAFDAVLSAIVISTDGGRSFSEHFTPRGLIADFVVDPEDPDHLLADNDEELFESRDGGDGWRPLLRGRRLRLAWPAPGRLYRADQDGTIYTSADGGQTFTRAAKVVGEPYKFAETGDPDHLYLALSDGSILETTDGAQTWDEVFRP